MSQYAHQLLTDCLVAQGVDPEAAARAVELLLSAAVAADLIQVTRLDNWERDARIYHLRGQRVTCVDIAARFTMNRATVFEAIRRHQSRRRAALRLVS